MFNEQNVLNAMVLTLLLGWFIRKMFSVVERKISTLRSEVRGSEGKIVTYHSVIFNTSWYVSQSETKWHLDGKYKKVPVWFSAKDGYPTLFIGKTALFYEPKKMKEIRQDKKSK